MEMYYMQDSRMFLGNTVVWWAESGYTANVQQAKLFTKEEADKQHTTRETDIPWPKAYIDAKTCPTVDMQHIERREAERAIAHHMVQLPKCGHCDDIITQASCYLHGCKRWHEINGKIPS